MARYLKRVAYVPHQQDGRISYGKIYKMCPQELYIMGDNGKEFKPSAGNVKYWLTVTREAWEEQENRDDPEYDEQVPYINTNEESNMAYRRIKLEETTMLNDSPAANYSDDDLISYIELATAEMERLSNTGVAEGKYVAKRVASITADRDALTALLDLRVEEE